MQSISIYSLLVTAILCFGTASLQAAEASPRELERIERAKKDAILSLITARAVNDKGQIDAGHNPLMIADLIDGYAEPLVCPVCMEECTENNPNVIPYSCTGSNIIHPYCRTCMFAAFQNSSLGTEHNPHTMCCHTCRNPFGKDNMLHLNRTVSFELGSIYYMSSKNAKLSQTLTERERELDEAYAARDELEDNLNQKLAAKDRQIITVRVQRDIQKTLAQACQHQINHQNFLLQTMHHKEIRKNRIQLKAQYEAAKKEAHLKKRFRDGLNEARHIKEQTTHQVDMLSQQLIQLKKQLDSAQETNLRLSSKLDVTTKLCNQIKKLLQIQEERSRTRALNLDEIDIDALEKDA